MSPCCQRAPAKPWERVLEELNLSSRCLGDVYEHRGVYVDGSVLQVGWSQGRGWQCQAMVSMWEFPIDQEGVMESTGLDPSGWDPAQEGPLQGKNTLMVRCH